ncbi:MAG: mechanosensitive ion channel domain-containing protein [Muribaculaceae bacterium]
MLSVLLVVLGNRYKSLLTFKNKDTVNHTLQVLTMLSFLLFFIALWVIGLKTSTDNKELIPVGLITVILPLVFKDSIAGAIAYFHIHTAGLLHIGDWIQVPSYHIDGMVKDINLVSVIIENWDNTLSNVPISALQNGGFKNYQQMLNGKTSGRRMLRSFIIDTNSVVEYGKDEVENLIKIVKEKDNLSEQNPELYNPSRRIKNVFTGTPILNLRLFREYLDFWLASNTNISSEPRLIVRVMEQTIEGIPLQVYVFIVKSGLVEFEKVQSKITEHIITSMEWFGLKLYQRPASADIKNDNLKN